MRLIERGNTLVCVTALIAAFAFAAADEKPEVMLLALPAVVGGWLVGRRAEMGQPLALPKLAVNLLVMAAIGNAALQLFSGVRSEPIVSVLGLFLVYILLVKLFDRRQSRDEAQVLSLSLFVVIASILTSNSLVVGLLLLIYTPLATLAAMVWQLRDGERWARGDRARAAPPVAGRWAGADLLSVCGTAVVMSCLLAAVVFVATPRGRSVNIIGSFGVPQQAQTGFSETVRLGTPGLLSSNPTPMLDVTVRDPLGNQAGAEGRIYYLRGAVNDTYMPADGVWRSSNRSDGGVRAPAGSGIRLANAPRGSAVMKMRVEHRAEAGSRPGETTIFTVWRPLLVRPDVTMRIQRSGGDGVVKGVREGQAGRLGYEVDFVEGLLEGAEPSADLGFQSGRIRDLAESVLRDKGLPVRPDPEDPIQLRSAASALRDFIRTNFAYTTEMYAPGPGEDPIEMFLFSTRRGHCEYFASAHAAMCQAVGVHARVVTGYLATEFNSLAGQYVVRQSNAHAWTEVHVGNGRWQTFEPTPEAEIQRLHGASDTLAARALRWYEALELSWSSLVVGFDRDSSVQAALFGSRGDRSNQGLLSRLNRAGERLAAEARAEGERSASRWSLVTWIPGVIAVGAAGWVAWRAVRAWQAQRRGPGAGDPELAALLAQTDIFERAERLLARAGHRRPEVVAPGAFAETLDEARPGLGRHARRLAELYYRVRYGRAKLSPGELADAKAALDGLQAELAAARGG